MKYLGVIGASSQGLRTALKLLEDDSNVILIIDSQSKIDELKSNHFTFDENDDINISNFIKYGKENRLYLDSTINEKINNLDALFICTELTSKGNGLITIDPIKEILSELNNNYYRGKVIIRSTINLGNTYMLQSNNPKLKLFYLPTLNSEVNMSTPKYNINMALGIPKPYRSDLLPKVRSNKESSTYIGNSALGIGKSHMNDLFKDMQWITELFMDSVNEFNIMDSNSVEITKLATDSLILLKSAFLSELSILSANSNSNLSDILTVLNQDKRLFINDAKPSLGYSTSGMTLSLNSLLVSSDINDAKMRTLDKLSISNKFLFNNIYQWIKKLIHTKYLRNVLIIGSDKLSFDHSLINDNIFKLANKLSKICVVEMYAPLSGLNEVSDKYFDLIIIYSPVSDSFLNSHSNEKSVIINLSQEDIDNTLIYGNDVVR